VYAPELPALTRSARSARRAAGLGLALAVGLSGCGREFYRNWADQDVSEAVFEKSRDPRWRIDLFTVEPPALSRFADGYDPDRPPAPPDDRAAEALSPVPQWPHHRLLVPAEATGYIDLLESWQRDRPYVPPATGGGAQPPTTPAPLRRPTPAPGGPRATPAPGLELPEPSTRPPFGTEPPATAPMPVSPPETTPQPSGNPGSPSARLSPIPTGRSARLSAPSSATRSAVATTIPATSQPAQPPRQDTRVQLTAFQVPDTAAPGASQPGGRPDDPLSPENVEPGRPERLLPDLDPAPGVEANPAQLPDRTLRMTPEAYQEAGRASAGLAALLSPTSEPISDYEAAALPPGSTIYKINPAQALTLALMNSRSYQAKIESVYLRALDVTLARFNFEPQFYAGMSPSTAPPGGIASPNNVNSWTYRTREAPGGQTSVLSFGTAAGVGKALSFGGTLVAGFANSVVFNLTGQNPVQPTVQSVLPIQYAQPLLQGGGRAVTLEPLTLAERNLLYEVRSFARFRQEYMPSVLAAGLSTTQGATSAGGLLGGGTTDGQSVGFLNVLQQYQVVENDRKILAAYAAINEAFSQMAEGAGAGVSQLNVDQVSQNLEQQRIQLINDTTTLRNLLDQYKIQLGLPPDLPLILDRDLISGFRDVFRDVDDWFGDENRDPQDLQVFVDRLPTLEDVVIDGRKAIEQGKNHETLEDVLLAAERLAMENRYELMNARAQLYDQWRQLAVRANALKGIFDIRITNQVFTPTATSNPFAFSDQAKNFALVFNTELPLIRVNERNALRQAEIGYRQSQRALMQQEDTIKLQVRTDIRNLIQVGEQYRITRDLLVVSLRQRDNSARLIFQPTTGTGGQDATQQITANTTTLINGINQTLGAQNSLIRFWVQYQSTRLALYRDLGVMPYDEWEAYYELFPAKPTGPAPGAGRTAPRRAASGAAGAAPGRS
jgi:hypothetical protein